MSSSHPVSLLPYPNTLSRNAANYVGDTVNEYASGASKEANKSVAKDSNADASTRLTAGKDALSDKLDETKNSVCDT